ncbi:hypothetical protein BGX33_011986 [Mortierella sp. NVP41]|nr:hypothetical protein BGX33_011986 [Mortierella sp. NVP41]
MHHYQPIPDKIDIDIESGGSLDENDIESHVLPPKYQQLLAPSSPQQPQYPILRKPWVILSLPIAIAVLISTSVYVCLSSSSSSSTYVYPSAIGDAIVDQPCADRFPSSGVLSSSSWPRIPFMPVSVSVSGVNSEINNTNLLSGATVEEVTVQESRMNENDSNNSNGGDGDSEERTEIVLGGIEIISVDPFTVEQAIEDLREEIDAAREKEEEDGDDEEVDDEEDEYENEDKDWDDDEEEVDDERADGTTTTAMLEEIAALEALVGQAIPEIFDSIETIVEAVADEMMVTIIDTVNLSAQAFDDDGMNLDVSDGFGGSGDAVVTLSLRRNDSYEEEEDEEEDEDEQDHFPTNIDNDDDEDDDEGEDGEETSRTPNPTRKEEITTT